MNDQNKKNLVSVVMGSLSDWDVMKPACDTLGY